MIVPLIGDLNVNGNTLILILVVLAIIALVLWLVDWLRRR
jgi:hypothetical protein